MIRLYRFEKTLTFDWQSEKIVTRLFVVKFHAELPPYWGAVRVWMTPFWENGKWIKKLHWMFWEITYYR